MTFPFKIITNSPEETEGVGKLLAEAMTTDTSLPRFIAMYGDLGVGKTAFVRGFSRVISPDSAVRSPTFALVNEYRSKGTRIYHFDMYRIASEDDLYSIGFYDYLLGNDICIAEWCENIPYAIPESYISVNISKSSAEFESEREILINFRKA